MKMAFLVVGLVIAGAAIGVGVAAWAVIKLLERWL